MTSDSADKLVSKMLKIQTTDSNFDQYRLMYGDKLQALITDREAAARIDQMELLRWKYKELNDQSVSLDFLEAYNILMDELALRALLANPSSEGK